MHLIIAAYYITANMLHSKPISIRKESNLAISLHNNKPEEIPNRYHMNKFQINRQLNPIST